MTFESKSEKEKTFKSSNTSDCAVWMLTCPRFALWLVGWEGGSAVWVGRFYKQIVSHWAPRHSGRLDVRTDRCHTRRTRLLSGLGIGGQLYSERVQKVKRRLVSESNLKSLYYSRPQKGNTIFRQMNINDRMTIKTVNC